MLPAAARGHDIWILAMCILAMGLLLPPYGRRDPAARHVAYAARSPNCAAAILALAQASLHEKSLERICENDCIDDIKITHRHAQV